MWTKRVKAPASENAGGIDRRRFVVGGGAALLLAPFALRPLEARAAHHEKAGLAADLKSALEKSPYVYVSPLKGDGAESTCHGEVWYGWQDGGVLLVTSKESWKARAVARGLDRARLWVGDHGRWKGAVYGTNEDFRKAPRFDAKVSVSKDADAFAKLMASYAGKYGTPFTSKWKPRMEEGFADGSRVLLRYEPA